MKTMTDIKKYCLAQEIYCYKNSERLVNISTLNFKVKWKFYRKFHLSDQPDTRQCHVTLYTNKQGGYF